MSVTMSAFRIRPTCGDASHVAATIGGGNPWGGRFLGPRFSRNSATVRLFAKTMVAFGDKVMKSKYLVLMAWLALTSLAFADDIEFAEVDTDKDGFVSKEESVAIVGLKKVFANFDADGDDKLSEEEFTNYMDTAEAPKQGG